MMRPYVAAVSAVLLLVVGCGAPPDAGGSPSTERGQLVSSSEVAAYDVADTAKALQQAGFDAGHVQYGVVAHKIVYRTVDVRGQPTTASGLLVLPDNHVAAISAVVYAHGTTTFRADVASQWNDDYTTAPALMFAAAGFAAVLPDYLGLGDGPGIHPWMHVSTMTSASLDMLRAARDLVGRGHRTLARDVLTTGFSQGASAALGLAHVLQDGVDPAFSVAAVAPISGAYDFTGAELPALLSGQLDRRSSVAYTALMLTSWNRSFGLYDSPDTVFAAPYAHEVTALFDGTTPGETMLQALPDTVDQLLTDDGRRLLERPIGNLRVALAQVDAVCDWAPTVPIRLYVADGDEQAATANTRHCRELFHGDQVSTISLGTPQHFDSRHIGSNVAGTAAALAWFLELRPER